MATDKKKEVKMKDLKPNKDAKGGAARHADANRGTQMNRNNRSPDSNRGNANSNTRSLS